MRLCTVVGVMAAWLFSISGTWAAGQVLPDEFKVNLGPLTNIGENVTLVLTKRSVRSDDYQIGTVKNGEWTRIAPFPVSTYRGYVEGNPVIRVNGNVEPGGMLNVNFSDGRGLSWVQLVEGVFQRKIEIPEGKSTALMSAGNTVVPFKPVRQSPTPGGYFVPPVPMRRIDICMLINSNYVNDVASVETAVSRCEARISDADFFFARDIGLAWEVTRVAVSLDGSSLPRDYFIKKDGRRSHVMITSFSGSVGRPHHYAFPKMFKNPVAGLNVANLGIASSGLGHEAAHNLMGYHGIDLWDSTTGAASRIGVGNIQRMVQYIMGEATEELCPQVIYNGALPPLAMNDFANATKDQPVTIDVLDNDYSGNGYTLSLQSVDEKSWRGAAVKISADRQTVVYTPLPGFVGGDYFMYTVVDSTGVPNRTGYVKVEVREEGTLASYLPLDEKDPSLGGLGGGMYPDHGPYAAHGVPYFDYLYDGVRRYVGGPPGLLDDELYEGVKGKALFINGVNRTVLSINHTGDPGRESLSVSLWVLFPPADRFGGTVISKGGTLLGTPAISGWAIHGGPDGFKFFGNTRSSIVSNTFGLRSTNAVLSNAWYHLAMVMDRKTERLRAWVNNEEVKVPNETAGAGEGKVLPKYFERAGGVDFPQQPIIPDGEISSQRPLMVGGSFFGKGVAVTKVLVDEIRIYTGVLTEKQVDDLYAEGQGAEVLEWSARSKPEGRK